MRRCIIALIEVALFVAAVMLTAAWIKTNDSTIVAFAAIVVIAMIATIAESEED